MSDYGMFCGCAGGRQVKDENCGEVVCKRAPLPTIHMAVSGDTMRAGGEWFHILWYIYAERIDADSARVEVKASRKPGTPIEHVADITVHCPDGGYLEDEVQAVASAILWSRLRRGWMEDEE